MRRGLAAFAALAVAAALVASRGRPGTRPAAGAEAHPNVLLLMVDGFPTATTPAMESLAKHSRIFDRAYLTHPLAGQSRAALFLGQRPERYDVLTELLVRPDGAVLLSERFAQAGYEVARVGRAVSGGFDGQLHWDRALAPGVGADTGQQVASLLAGTHDKPFFLVAGFDDLGPVAPAPTAAASLPLGPEGPAIAVDDLLFTSRPGARRAVPAVAEEARQQAVRLQEERTRRFDAQLARIVAALDRAQAWERTIVVLAGIQAPSLGGHGVLPRPDMLFEDSLHAPLLISGPGVREPGRPTDAFADLTDVYPTLLEMAGLPAVAGLDGRSQTAVLRDPAASVRTAAASVVWRDPGHVGRSLRTSRWRYTEWPEGSSELYDHRADPQESTNLAHRPESAATVAGLQSLMAARAREFSAPAPPPAAAPRSGRRPNVLLVVFDDLNVHVGAYGASVQTPNIDRLAHLGRRFEHAYAQVAQCSPSRTSLLSGWQPERANIWNNSLDPRRPGMVPIEEHFGANGYFTAQIGKVWETAYSGDFHWDVSEYDPVPAGSRVSPEAGADTRDDDESTARREKKQGRLGWWAPTDGGDADEPDGRRARRAAQLIEQKRDRPFFLAVGFAKPHLRWLAPRRYFDLYDPAQVRFPAPPADLAGVPAIALRHRIERPGLPLVGHEPVMLPDPKLRRDAIAAYHATVTFVDAQLGVLLGALDRSHRWDDTVVVILGDHGYHLGEHGGLWRKDTLFEEGLRVPLVIAGRDVAQPGQAAGAPVELLDVYPTLVDLAGLPPVAGGIDGKSLVPLLRDPMSSVREGALSWRPVAGTTLAASVRSGKWRYTQWPDGSEELFDLEQDPQQRDDLARRPAAQAALEAMRARRIEALP